MKILLRILFASGCIYLGLKLLIPYHLYPIEHFEYQLANFLPFSWKLIAVVSRIMIGFLFLAAFLFLFYWQKIKWTKFIAPFMIAIPFILNAVFVEDFKDKSTVVNEKLSFEPTDETNEPVLIAYLSFNCVHCKEALFKLEAARKKEKSFPKVIIVSYNYKLDEFLDENNLSFPIDSISPQLFMEITNGSFPKFALVQNNLILRKYEPEIFNYAVLDNLSTKNY